MGSGTSRTSGKGCGFFTTLLFLYLACSGYAAVESHSFLGQNRSIPDGNPAGLADVRVIDSAMSSVSCVRVRLWITGDYNGDLYAYLRHTRAGASHFCVLLNRPGRASTHLWGDEGAGFGVLLADTGSCGDIHNSGFFTHLAGSTPILGDWRPDGRACDPRDVLETSARSVSLGSLVAQPPGGEWTLFIADVDSGGTNVLAGWEIEFEGDNAFLPIPNQIAHVQSPLAVTNILADSNRWPGPLIYGMGQGAPSGSHLDPATGIFHWTPSREQAGTLNMVSVWVRDSASEPASATNTFTILVEDYAELLFGQAVGRAGQVARLPITLITSTQVSDVQALLNVQDDRLTNLALVDGAPVLSSMTVSKPGDNLWRLEFSTGANQSLQATQEIAWMEFHVVSNRSAFITVEPIALASFQTNGNPVWTIANPGRVVAVEQEPLLEAFPSVIEHPRLVLYGIPTSHYVIQAAPDLSHSAGWTPLWEGTMPENQLEMSVEGLTNTGTGPAIFYRAEEKTNP
jgi:subtilisin-like proprotein convertase family protein